MLRPRFSISLAPVIAVVLTFLTLVPTPMPAVAQTGPVRAEDKPGGTLLSGAEMRALYDNGAIIDWEDHGSKGSVALIRHGFAFQVWVLSTGIGDMDKGRWRIDGDTICFKWQFSRQGAGIAATPYGEETCWRHYHVGGNRYEARPVKEAVMGGPFILRK